MVEKMRMRYATRRARRLSVKTTIDLPLALLKQAKHHAVENETTLRALIIAGLKEQLNRKLRR